jgi:hypothetical protein
MTCKTSALPTSARRTTKDLEDLQASWTNWNSTANPPVRDRIGTFHFDDASDLLPNKSPAEVLKEGCFGGTYFRPFYSFNLGDTISDDWRELPSQWVEGINVYRNLFIIS